MESGHSVEVQLRSKYRTHTCGELRTEHVGQQVIVSGWVLRKRDHGAIAFVDLRDHYGVTQVVIGESFKDLVNSLRVESVISVRGAVRARDASLVNPKIATGSIEVHAVECEVLSQAETLPFQIAEDDNAPETTRLKFRFLELRREKLHRHIALRNVVVRTAREIMHSLGFSEFHTPILTSSSPEGARDFIVPSRLHPGKFYALPQAPQQFKQLLMIAGFDRYFQIAPCFRDEDARADRSPGEFYQIDMELSFVEQEDVLRTNEALISELFGRCSLIPAPSTPFPRFKYRDAIERFGTDKPDLRIPNEIRDFSKVFGASEFRVFREALGAGRKVRGIVWPVAEIPSRRYFDDAVEFFSKLDRAEPSLGLAYLVLDSEGHKGSISKFVSAGEVEALRSLAAGGKAVIFIAAGDDARILPALGKLRVKLGHDFKQVEQHCWRFCWITDFPFYEKDEENNSITFAHNPFSMPQGGLDSLCSKPPLEILAQQYDLVCHGYELASGGLRNHTPEVMYKAFELTGYTREEVDAKFGGMIRAFRFGAPPHGGIAHGIERIVMLLAGEDAIREVIAFPLAQNGEDLLMGAPSSVSEKQLREVHIQLRAPAVGAVSELSPDSSPKR